MTRVLLKKLPHGQDLPTPFYATSGAAAVDLCAAITDDITLKTLERAIVPTGFAMALPAGYEAQIRARSGLAAKHGIGLVNGIGTIDADYRGEVGVILVNLSAEPFTITRGMRIAQMVIAPYTQVTFDEVETLDDTARGTGGFGSTGVETKTA